MDYFFAKFTRNLKNAVSIVAGGSCIAIITLTLLGISTVAIPFLAGIAIFPAGLIFFENNYVIIKMEKLVKKLNEQVESLSFQMALLETRNEELKETSENLKKVLDDANNRIKELKVLTIEYRSTNNELKENLERSNSNANELDKAVSDLLEIKKQYELRMLELKTNLDKAQEQLDILISIKVSQEKELGSLRTTTNSLKIELKNMENMYVKSKEVIATFLKTQDIFQDLHADMIQTEENMEGNVNQMSKLISLFGKERTDEMFNKIDTNKDGILTKEEFINILLESNQ